MADSSYGPFFNKFTGLADGAGSIVHVDFKPAGGLSKCLSAPATEIATFYFEGEPPSDYFDGVHKFDQITQEAGVPGFLGLAIGKTHEEVERECVKGHAMVLAIGWQSVDLHMEYRASQGFKDNIHLLRSTAKKIEMHHVAFMQSL